MSIHGGYVETKITTKDPGRVYYVNAEGQIVDLMPTSVPPIILGLAQADPKRILVDFNGGGLYQDVQPNKVGLTAQSVAALTSISPVK